MQWMFCPPLRYAQNTTDFHVMQNLTFGSLFAGIGGFDLGFERAGMECTWQCENNKFCQKILNKHWPNVKKYYDIKEIRRIEPVDVICGGFPCQDISHAGKRVGIIGEKSGLWKEMLRIIRSVRPKYVAVEAEYIGEAIIMHNQSLNLT